MILIFKLSYHSIYLKFSHDTKKMLPKYSMFLTKLACYTVSIIL